MGSESTRGDNDVYFRLAQKSTGETYYEYILFYVDDILCVSHDTTSIIKRFSEMFRLQEGSMGPPFCYLGADIVQRPTNAGDECWAMSSHLLSCTCY